MLCEHISQEHGYKDESRHPIIFNIEEFHLEMLPLDQDLISLDMNSAFTVCAFALSKI